MKERTTLCSVDQTMRQTLATFSGNVSILLFFHITYPPQLLYGLAIPIYYPDAHLSTYAAGDKQPDVRLRIDLSDIGNGTRKTPPEKL
ncbi:hypothetical protein MUZ84_004524 [Salmonella enterica]|nr:hypothetical protein [Salmonella enterica]EJA8225962.1 hypothetical protein [Salmonella enterica]